MIARWLLSLWCECCGLPIMELSEWHLGIGLEPLCTGCYLWAERMFRAPVRRMRWPMNFPELKTVAETKVILELHQEAAHQVGETCPTCHDLIEHVRDLIRNASKPAKTP